MGAHPATSRNIGYGTRPFTFISTDMHPKRFLALTGPAGTGKSATIRVLAREISFEILEWKSGVDDRFGGRTYTLRDGPLIQWITTDFEGEAQMQKFEAFLKRVSACASILGDPRMPVAVGSSSHTPRSGSVDPTRRIILLEDIPNVLHAPTQLAFHSALESLIDSTVPVVIIVSDSGVRGEDAEHVGSGGWRGGEVVDVRTVLGPLLSGPYVTQIAWVVSRVLAGV
jgi:cell cycle checkpoint protein